MKRSITTLCASILLATPLVFAQNESPIALPAGYRLPVKHINARQVLPQSGAIAPAGTTVPLYQYTYHSDRDGNSYTGTIVGQPPAKAGTVTIPTVIIPVNLKFQYSATSIFQFDPSAADPGCIGAGNTALSLTTQSPLFTANPWVMDGTAVGTTQYPDAFQRAEWWRLPVVQSSHTFLRIFTAPEQTITLTASNSASAEATVYSVSGVCGTNTGNVNVPGSIGVVDINMFDVVAQSIITKLGLTPTEFPLFLFYNAVMSDGPAGNLNNCCILGYHSALGTTITNPGQTYGVAEFEGRYNTVFTGVGDVAAMSHEVSEWMNDPAAINPTPAWGNIGQVAGCQANFEVGDPLSGTLFPTFVGANGFSYHLQEMAYISWFYSSHPLGTGGFFSNNGTFTTDAGPVCGAPASAPYPAGSVTFSSVQ